MSVIPFPARPLADRPELTAELVRILEDEARHYRPREPVAEAVSLMLAGWFVIGFALGLGVGFTLAWWIWR